ncbi:MAG: hypothetical protein P4M11_16015 [Candidatus Pacebacteria bacterium]|nr:hypothetical protein [Candidatus Paceibacterota bacterium]
MPKDPRYQNNAAKFFGVEQQNRRTGKPLTYEQRLQKFIGL